MEEIKQIIEDLQYKVDDIEEIVDELEDRGVDINGLRNSLASFWTEYHSLAESYEL
jgi:uncharacterized protein YoxC